MFVSELEEIADVSVNLSTINIGTEESCECPDDCGCDGDCNGDCDDSAGR